MVFLGVAPNRQDSVTEIASYARVHEISFPIVKDLNQVLADQVCATRTPEVVVLDKEHAVRYRGRIDDQYGFKSNANYPEGVAKREEKSGRCPRRRAGLQARSPPAETKDGRAA